MEPLPHKRSASGFTLIELLLVVSIIGLLASVIIASVDAAQSKARDAVRTANMATIHDALEMYANGHDGQYPTSIPGGAGTWWNWECGNANDSNHQFMPYLVTDGDISKVPEETYWPIDGNRWRECTYRYVSFGGGGTACGSSSGNYAVLYAEFENPTGPNCHSSCVAGWGWGEAQADDPNGCLLILPE